MLILVTHSRTDQHNIARSTFQDVSTKNLDYPEALWDAWLSFEHAHGSLASLEDALVRIERARTQVEARRAKVRVHSSSPFLGLFCTVNVCGFFSNALSSQEAQKAYEAAQYAMERQAVVPDTSVPVPDVGQGKPSVGTGDGMDVDVPAPSSEARGKRKASDEPEPDVSGSKKARMGMFSFVVRSRTTAS
jgi:hypothetical protein